MTKLRARQTMPRLVVAALVLCVPLKVVAQEDAGISVSVSPASKLIPANTLRLYINFSEPMLRGQVRKHIHLEDSQGNAVFNPFLNLGTELWNENQTRITLLFDPGRTKQGLSSNKRYGLALEEGARYALLLNGRMESASGVQLQTTHRFEYQITAPERRPIRPEQWRLRLPKYQTNSGLEVRFQRQMDSGAAARFIRVKKLSGEYFAGKVEYDGDIWRFQPTAPWASADYELVVHPSLEDVSGNTPQSEFDQPIVAAAHARKLISLPFSVHFDN